MEGFDLTLGRGIKPAFDDAPASVRCRIDGVDYLWVQGRQGGDLYLTREGWPEAARLTPDRWYTGDRFQKAGRALAGATGAVYRVPVEHPANPRFALVVKFSRVGQEVGITVVSGRLRDDPEFMNRVAHAEFLPPFEEFGNLCRLRRRCRGLFATHAPLAIYSPPTRYLPWQLGRKQHLRSASSIRLRASQGDTDDPGRVVYDWERLYILLYRWMDGFDVEQAVRAGIVPPERAEEWTADAAARLRELGWVVLDHKPRHLILRSRRGTGPLVVRNGRPALGLVDYELLYPC